MVDFNDPAVLHDIFTYHAPEPDQIAKYQKLRDGAEAFAKIIVENTPKCADQSHAIRLVRDSVMFSNAAVALKGIV